jgi:hypothetical protein
MAAATLIGENVVQNARKGWQFCQKPALFDQFFGFSLAE